ncbi:MAG TPA: septal ring lytic transglycosylase RlpA family protein [Thermoanaerobaculia bacterium]|nr:septal ring lytic transglycosylase RlpA family protein [Thermoanaerobaculia bacterium]
MTPRDAARFALLAALVAGIGACAAHPPARPVPHGPPAPGWTEEGVASWYGGRDGFEGKPTASGEIYDSSLLTAAHRKLPLGTVVDVTNLNNERTVRVRINDRGPFIFGRVIDLSRAAAETIGLIGPGIGPVRVTVVTPGIPQEVISRTGRWAVQVGSFADQLRAERHAERLRGTGRFAFLEPYRGLTRVKVGPFDGRRDAEHELALLEEDGFEGIVVPTD